MAKPKEVKKSEFEIHAPGCDKCKSIDLDKPASFAGVCFVGASLLRDHIHAMQAPKVRAAQRALKRQFQDADGGNFRTTKKKLQEIMRYQGDLL
jgi:hypothetical protein